MQGSGGCKLSETELLGLLLAASVGLRLRAVWVATGVEARRGDGGAEQIRSARAELVSEEVGKWR